MHAVQLTAYGGKESITVQETEKPKPSKGEVLVEVIAAGLNPFDWKVRDGMMKDFIPLELPATLGGDLVGRIVEVGEEISEWHVGEVVFGQAGAVSGKGSWAEYAPVKASSLAIKPDNIGMHEAGGASLVCVSAYQALVETLNVQPGQKILIHGGAGGIGNVAIQIAKHLGAEIAATASAEDEQFVKRLGADTFIDYRTQDFSELLSGYDAVYDTVGGDTALKSYQVLRQGGKLVSMVAEPDETFAQQCKVSASHQASQPNPARLNAVAELLKSGAVQIHVDKVFQLSEAAEALEYLKTGSPRGKVVLQMRQS
jgi:NADPH:quinone reductase-like Zn-dependent oxidoreductase